MALEDIVLRLASRAATTEADIQADVRAVLLDGDLDLADEQLVLESQVGGGRRIDVEAGTTVIEVKKRLGDDDAHRQAVRQLAGYVADRVAQTGHRYVGILTDGAVWELYSLSGEGEPYRASDLRLSGEAGDADRLCVWLEGVLATAQGLEPSAAEVERRLGARSSGFALDVSDLSDIYAAHRRDPEVAMKRELWARLLASALGTHFEDSDELFVLHTYLVVSAELIAHACVGLEVVGQSAPALLSGALFREAGLGGVVEPDFFDWPVDTDRGDRFVAQLGRRITRFRWQSVEHDVLKVLYESVIPKETRKKLGEYYTPDWLAEWMVSDAVQDPLEERVLDPACGSGTFVFWAVRRVIEAAEEAGLSNSDAVQRCVERVFGIDLHPVAVALARVTYLLAIGPRRLREDRPAFSVPIYLGDSLRWEQDDTLLSAGGVTVYTTDGAELFARELHFPERVVADAGRFDQLVAELATRASARTTSQVPAVAQTLNRFAIHDDDRPAVEQTFRALCELHDEGRDHIWGYYVRNLARPLWFTREGNRPDVLVGNPPWLAYRFMSEAMQAQYRALSQDRDLWAGGKVSTHQDLSDLFVVRAVEQYLRDSGRFAFVMPAAVLSRRQYEGFRTGLYEAATAHTAVAFTESWDLRQVNPDPFPVPCCVIRGVRTATPEPLSTEALVLSGRYSGRRWQDVSQELAEAHEDVAQVTEQMAVSPYGSRFYQGATVTPRVLATVRSVAPGPLGVPTGQVRVESLRSALEKEPWKSLDPLSGAIESQFVRRMYVGLSAVPFGLRGTVEAIIPWDGQKLLEATDSDLDRYPALAAWWRTANDLWQAHRKDKSPETLTGRLDYQRALSLQFPIGAERVVYTTAGKRICAGRVTDSEAVIDNTLYWGAVASSEEGHYLCAVLNSDAVHERVEPLMSEGLFGKRHVHKYVFLTDFPLFDPEDELHVELAGVGRAAEEAIEALELAPEGSHVQARRTARQTLASRGLDERIESLVTTLLDRQSSAA